MINAFAPTPPDKHVQAITLGRVAFRHHQALDLFEDFTVIARALDWQNVHDFYLQTACASVSIKPAADQPRR